MINLRAFTFIVLLALSYSFSNIKTDAAHEDIQTSKSEDTTMATPSICSNPLVYEFIIPFDIKLIDVQTLAKAQLSKLDLHPDFKTADKVSVSNILLTSLYDGSGRSIDPKEQAIKHRVTNDSIEATITYQASIPNQINPLLTKKFNGTTKTRILMSYTKEINTQTGKLVFSEIVLTIDPKKFNMTYTNSPSTKETSRLDKANTDAAGPSILTTLQKQLSVTNINRYFSTNSENEKISGTYQSTYNYKYYEQGVTFDMSTQSVSQIEGGLSNGLKATIKDTPFCPSYLPDPQQNYHTFFTLQFILNWAKDALNTYAPYKSININKGWVKSDVFKFRLIDLEFVVGGLLDKYPAWYMNEVYFVATMSEVNDGGVSEESNGYFWLTVTWLVKGYVKGDGKDVLIVDSVVKTQHNMKLSTSSSSLSSYVDNLKLISASFTNVDELIVTNKYLAENFVKETFNWMRVYTLGTFFKVKEGSSKIKYANSNGLGIWVG